MVMKHYNHAFNPYQDKVDTVQFIQLLQEALLEPNSLGRLPGDLNTFHRSSNSQSSSSLLLQGQEIGFVPVKPHSYEVEGSFQSHIQDHTFDSLRKLDPKPLFSGWISVGKHLNMFRVDIFDAPEHGDSNTRRSYLL